MLDDQIKEAIQTAYRQLSAKIPGFQPRDSQRRMIAAVANTLSGCGPSEAGLAVIEGQTGTGKSIGYMLGAIPVAQDREYLLVISTATVALQEQLFNRDLPTLRDLSGLDFSFTLAKGRRRYACTRNIQQLAGNNADQEALDLGADHEGSPVWDRPPKDGEVDCVQTMQAKLESQSWNGDLDEWGEDLDADFRAMITTDNKGCSGAACAYVRQCPFMKARAGLRDYDVVIANHDLVLSDFEMGGGVILTPPEETLYVFDEGHHLPDKAVNRFAVQTRLQGSVRWIQRLPRLASRIGGLLNADQAARKKASEIAELAAETGQQVNEMVRLIGENFPAEKKRYRGGSNENQPEVWRFPQGVVPDAFLLPAGELAQTAMRLCNAVNSLSEILSRAMKEKVVAGSSADKLAQDIGYAAGRCENLRDTWSLWSQTDPENAPPTARWVERSRDSSQELTVAASPISAAALLKKLVWQKVAGAVVTSATITALNSFGRFQRASGLREQDGVQFLRLASPFNYQKCADLWVPWMDIEPRDAEAHTAAVADHLAGNLNLGEGTLVLFASGWQMRQVRDRLPQSHRAQLLVQNEAPKAEILRRHKERIESGQGSIIFGLASFAEGVDLPGTLCTHVVIAKIPFAVPDSPVEATRAEWVEALKRNPFLEISVPDASLKLVQATGRLIRSENDYGRVTILDRRVVTKAYGRHLLEALPPMRQHIERVQHPNKTACAG